MYLTYLDDSGSTGSNLTDQQSPFQVVAGVMVKDLKFQAFEAFHALVTDDLSRATPDGNWESFEIKAKTLYWAHEPFKALGQERCRELFSLALSQIQIMMPPIIYGAVDKLKHQKGLFAGAVPIDVAFRICAGSVERWMEKNADEEMALIIVDDMPNPFKESIAKAFRGMRKKLRLKDGVVGMDPGPLKHIVDDLYFGDSKSSVGIQAADLCAFLIQRHLSGKKDSEYLYEQIKDCISFCGIAP